MVQTSNCPSFPPTDEIDSTRYRQFLWCVSEKDPLREAILPASPKQPPTPRAAPLAIPQQKLHRPRAWVTKTLAGKVAKKRKDWLNDLWPVHGIRVHECSWALGIEYQQTWKRISQHRGRLLGSAPLGLYPATRETTVRSWEKRFAKRTLNEALEEARTLEIGANDRWSLAAKKQFVSQSNSSFNPSATLNSVTIPTSTAPVSVGGNLGISGALTTGTANTLDRGTEFIAENTVTAIESIKTTRATSIEESSEVGEERTGSETLANPNRCNTLTYCYYEVIERCEIVSRPLGVDLYLFVPLPYQDKVTLDWLLANECTLRPLVPCETLRRGFDAARKLRAAELVRQQRSENLSNAGTPTGGTSPARDVQLEAVVTAVGGLLDTYEKLSGARKTRRGVGSWLYWELINLLSANVADALSLLDERWANVDKSKRGEVSDAIADFRGQIGDVNAEFLKINAAVAVCEAYAAGVGLSIVPPLSWTLVVAVGAILAALESLGLDLLPDDCGLKAKIKRVFTKMDGALAPAIEANPASAAPGGIQSDYALSQAVAERLRAERALQDCAEAQVAVEALQTHIAERIFFYHQVLWSCFDGNRIKQRLLDLGLPAGLFELRFYGFDMDRAALRVTDFALAEQLGFKHATLKDWRNACADTRFAKTLDIMLPTSAVVVEPLLGQCVGADGFVLGHRDLDLARAEAQVQQEKAIAEQAAEETLRMRERIEQGLLGDPRPFAHAATLAVHVSAGNEAPAVE